jgi:N-methylhydantoinase A
MLAQGIGAEEVEFERVCDLRYSLQVNQVEVPAPGGSWDEDTVADLIGRFEAEYARLFGEGTGYAEAGFTATAMRVAGRAVAEDLSLRRLEEAAAVEPEPRSRRPVIFHESGSTAIETPVFDGGAIGPGRTIAGPAIVEFPDTGLVVRAGGLVSVDPHGSIVIEITKGHREGDGQ